MKMSIRLTTLFLLTMFIYSMAFGDDLPKVDPLLKMKAMELGEQPGLKVSAPAGTVEGPVQSPKRPKVAEKVTEKPKDIISSELRDGKLYLDTFITLTPGASTESLTKLGVIIGSRSGDIVTADVPPSLLDEVNALPEVVSVSGSRYGTPMNDAATTETGIAEVWNTMGYDGDGVLVGVVDSGIDWGHEDFKNPDGTSRILYIWDNTVSYAQGVGLPAPTGYSTTGTLWNKEMIDAGQSTEQDQDLASGGHGTHVTGSAAGDGSATGNGQPADRFKGVANKANIMFTKTNWTDQSWADACHWMYSVAGQLGKPMSINLSLGSIGGPHDGSSAIEQYLSGLLGGPGRAMAIAAANSGGQTIHAFSTLEQETGTGDNLNDTPIIGFWAYPLQTGIGVSAVELWYPAQSSVQWRVLWQEQAGWTASKWLGGTSEQANYTIQTGNLASVGVSAAANLPYDDGRNELNYGIVVVQSPNGGPALNGWWFLIQFKGQGVPVHAWHILRDQGSLLTAQHFLNEQVTPFSMLIEGDDNYTLGTPGTADKPVCVASYVSKNQWTDLDGNTVTQNGATVGEISSFSSRGPRRDGNSSVPQQKPDVSGPGEVLVSALSDDLSLNMGDENVRHMIERDGVHQKMQGTSMSSPVVAGLMALMLDKDPTLTSDQIKTILRNTARDAGDTGWDPLFGAGKIDAVAALNAVTGGQATSTPTPVVPTATPTTVPPTSTPTGVVPTSTPTSGVVADQGDVNVDGAVNTKDAIRLLRHIEGIEALTGQGLTNADANQDTQVNQSDVDWILDKTVGK